MHRAARRHGISVCRCGGGAVRAGPGRDRGGDAAGGAHWWNARSRPPAPSATVRFSTPVDLHRFFFGELRTDNELLYQEVHYLAYHYHWSEAEIMAMPRTKRALYLDVLSGEIERMNGAS